MPRVFDLGVKIKSISYERAVRAEPECNELWDTSRSCQFKIEISTQASVM
jgi:hypothetical protein